MVENENDRRVVRTREIIRQALMALMSERQYDKITVQDIIDRANIGRSTFYAHYATKDELLESNIDAMLENLTLHMADLPESGSPNRLVPVSEFFQHLKENHRIMKVLVKGNNTDLFIVRIQAYLERMTGSHISACLKERTAPAIPLHVLSGYISSTLIFLLKWWIDNKMQPSPEQMELYFHALVLPTLESIGMNLHA